MKESGDGMTIDNKTDALQEFAVVTLHRQPPDWIATWGANGVSVNGEPLLPTGIGITPAAAVADLWSKVAGYALLLRFTDASGTTKNVRWNGLWQEATVNL